MKPAPDEQAREMAEAFQPLAAMGKSDKEKLMALAETLAEWPLPDMATEDGKLVREYIQRTLRHVASEIVDTAGRM